MISPGTTLSHSPFLDLLPTYLARTPARKVGEIPVLRSLGEGGCGIPLVEVPALPPGVLAILADLQNPTGAVALLADGTVLSASRSACGRIRRSLGEGGAPRQTPLRTA